MSSPRTNWQPPGLVPTIVGGLMGAVVAFYIGTPIANSVAEEGLGGLGTALLVFFIIWCVGTGLGVGIGLVARRQRRPLVTALLAVPGMIGAVMLTFLVGRSVQSGIFLWPMLIGASVLALWLARVVAMLSDPPVVRED